MKKAEFLLATAEASKAIFRSTPRLTGGTFDVDSQQDGAVNTRRFLCGRLYAPYINCRSFIHSSSASTLSRRVWYGFLREIIITALMLLYVAVTITL